MESVKVMFHSMEEAQKFVLSVENYPFNVDLLCGRRVINGKSMLGILGFGLHQMLELRVHTDDCAALDGFHDKIRGFICGDVMEVAI